MATMHFLQLGHAFHLSIDSVEVLSRIHELDPARWAVTSLPVRDLQCDAALARVLDPAGKGRILVDQIVAARDWALARLARPESMAGRREVLRLDDLATGEGEGPMLRRAAERLLAETAASDRASVSLTQVRAFLATCAQAPANGDSIVPPEAVPHADGAQMVRDILATTGGAADKSGRQGVGEPQVAAFLAGCQRWAAWKAREADAELHPRGADTPRAAAIVAAVERKIDQYFAQCELVRAEPAAVGRFSLSADDLAAIALDDPNAINSRLRDLTIATPRADGVLDLAGVLNPAWEKALADLRTVVLAHDAPGFDGQLTVDRWRAARAVFQPWRDWQAARPAEPWDKIETPRLEGYLAGGGAAAEAIRAAIALDAAAAPELARLADLEKLLVLQRWLLELTNNFVGLVALYDPQRRTLFEVGSLVIDGRRLEFCMKVADRAAHKKIAADSRTFLVYTQVFEKDGGPALFEVAAPVTRGERGRLVVGKRGVFIAADGRILDCQIVDLIENPISVWEAAKAPFRRIAEFINKKIEDFAASKAKAAEGGALAKLETLPAAPPPPPPPPANKQRDTGMMVGMLAGGGIALAAVGSALAYIAKALSSINPISLLLVILSIVAAIAGFAGFLGWLKLRLRDAGPLLEANGWAINPRMRLSGLLARSVNRYPTLPPDSRRELAPRFVEPADAGEDEVAAARKEADADAQPGVSPWVIVALALLTLAVVVVTLLNSF